MCDAVRILGPGAPVQGIMKQVDDAASEMFREIDE
jgi:hypothetical protein